MNDMQQNQNPLFGNMQQFPQNMQNNQQGAWFGWNQNQARMQQQRPANMWWIPVQSLEEAKNVFVHPGETKWIMIMNAMMFAVKTVNEVGATDFQAYDFTPHIDVQQAPLQQNGNIALGEIMGVLERVLQKLNDMESEVATLKEVKANGSKSVRTNANGASATKPTIE